MFVLSIGVGWRIGNFDAAIRSVGVARSVNVPDGSCMDELGETEVNLVD